MATDVSHTAVTGNPYCAVPNYIPINRSVAGIDPETGRRQLPGDSTRHPKPATLVATST